MKWYESSIFAVQTDQIVDNDMYLKEITGINYKNILDLQIKLSPKINCFVGDNGMGKTNLLDAIYNLSFCKSYFNTADSRIINHTQDLFLIKGVYCRNDEELEISCGFKRGSKKSFKRDDKQYSKLIDHIGLIPLVMVSPSDQQLILGGSDERRKFIDGVISQYDRIYLDSLMKYNKVLVQRNVALKEFAKQRAVDKEMLDVYDQQLIRYGELIYKRRVQFIDRFVPKFAQFYDQISGERDSVSLGYNSDLNGGEFDNHLKSSLSKDLAMGYTTVGIHKDDLEFKMDDYKIKQLGSQGQNKTYLIALKLAQFQFVKDINGVNPILLFDDIFDKLDSSRVSNIIAMVADHKFGQIFISDTNREHIDHIFADVDVDYNIFYVENGSVKERK